MRNRRGESEKLIGELLREAREAIKEMRDKALKRLGDLKGKAIEVLRVTRIKK